MVESINPAACDLFQYSQEEVIGNNIAMLMPSPDRERHDAYLHRYHQTGDPHIIGIGREVTGLRKDGSQFPFRLAVSEVQFSGRKIYTGFIHDLSRQKEAEETLKEYASHLEEQVQERTRSLRHSVQALQQAKEEVSLSLEKEKELGQLKSRFVSMASHEFRTPLSAIQLSSSLIEKYAAPFDNPNITKHVARIKNAVGNLTTILNDFLSLAPPAFAVGHLHFKKKAPAITSKWVLVGFNGVLVIPKLPEYLYLYVTLFIKWPFIYRYN